MKRDMDLIRKILFALVEKPHTDEHHKIEIEGFSEEDISYHVKLLAEAGLIEAVNYSKHSRSRWRPVSLTWEGHDFLEAAKNETIWNKAKAVITEKGSGLVFDVLKATLIQLIKGQIAS